MSRDSLSSDKQCQCDAMLGNGQHDVACPLFEPLPSKEEVEARRQTDLDMLLAWGTFLNNGPTGLASDRSPWEAFVAAWHASASLHRPAPETRAGNQPDPYVSGLAQAGIRAERDRRIIERHVRWHDEALRLLQQVNTGYEGEWPEIADFVRRSTARIEQSSSEKASVQLCAPHGKDWLTCPECAKAAGIGGASQT